ncbi:MAG TPA: hypothetical protein DCL21_02110 [Alphaproteobacteria bacterium]|nr:hypothetical protein [Alphaproteobacteria bacterium]
MLIKKGAMFGLDARIALAIFGALSVISGAALYSAIKEAKIIAMVTEMREVAKGYESYYLDTGSQLPTKNTVALDVNKLISDTAIGWKGPYLQYGIQNPTTGYTLTGTGFPDDNVSIYYYTDADFGDAVNPTQCGTPCYAYLRFADVPLETANEIDLKIDGANDSTKGNIRLYGIGPMPRIVYWKFIKRN